jgi:hypothetical protein
LSFKDRADGDLICDFYGVRYQVCATKAVSVAFDNWNQIAQIARSLRNVTIPRCRINTELQSHCY